MGTLLRLLAEVGRGDLSTGRIYEGHVNARFLIERYGNARQRSTLGSLGPDGILGVWNTDAPDDPLRLVDGKLAGKKTFASGIDGLDHAIVTLGATAEGRGRQMLLVPVEGVVVDRSWWKPLGMRASGSHVADFTGMVFDPAWRLGGADDYLEQPWFSAGAIRFLAVQTGGMHALLDIAVSHLAAGGRATNPYQSQRIARMGVAVETGYLWLDRIGAAWAAAAANPSAQTRAYLLAAANGARGAVEAAALVVLEEAERAIGAAGMISPHPFERQMRDLRVYLRQPNPDGAAAAFGLAIAAGEWAPSPCEENR